MSAMKPFLRQAAAHYFKEHDISRICFIFPNRRSMVFFRKYLGEEAMLSGKPVTAPLLLPVNDFYYGASGMRKADRVRLLLILYECYSRLNPKAEPLDDFIFWGDVLLGDFDDVDKYLVDAGGLFSNVADFKEIQDGYSYLTDRQREAILNFISHFRDSGTPAFVSDNDEDVRAGANVKGKFLKIWNILFPLYEDFNRVLKEKGIAYEGQVYRELADRLDSEAAADIFRGRFPEVDRYVFIGLNALNECERKVMRKMRDAGIADFCWDYSGAMLRDKDNKSSFFMERNVIEFPQAFTPDGEGLPHTTFTALSVPSLTGQAKQIPEIFKSFGSPVDSGTAVVLPDENLLIPVLNSIPPDISEINVTMGYPAGNSEFNMLLSEAGALQMHLREKDGKWYFYHRQVWSILSNSVFKSAMGEDEAATAKTVREAARYYIGTDELGDSPLMRAIFTPVVKDPKASGNDSSLRLADYFQTLIATVATRLKGIADMEVELEFAKEYYRAIGQMRQCELDILPSTWIRLAGRMTGSISVPFKGEPLKGLQIMGPLETRALDFDNIVILSCNEGMFPRHSVSSSFIPHELRKGFGMPTYEYQDAVWAYYFYRMIQRATHVWMVFDSRTDMSHSGEESRYIKQLELHFNVPVRRMVAGAAVSGAVEEPAIAKTDEHVNRLRGINLSATALQTYLDCKARFFYSYVEGLKETEEVSESMDAAMTGSVFHETMEDLYKPHDVITKQWLESLKAEDIKPVIREKIMEKLHTFEVSGRNLIYEDMVLRYVMKVIQRDLELLREYGVSEFRILGIEQTVKSRRNGFRLKGVIDRMDSFRPGEIRIVDYKTGKVTDNDINISDENADKVVEALFGDSGRNRPKIALQLYLYDIFVKEMSVYHGERILNSIYQTGRLFTDKVSGVALSERFCELMDGRLSDLLDEIADTSVPFDRTEDRAACKYCDFKMICGR